MTDNAFEEVVGKWGDICSEAVIEQKQTEPHSPWQNRAKTEIKELKKEWSMSDAIKVQSAFKSVVCWTHPPLQIKNEEVPSDREATVAQHGKW